MAQRLLLLTVSIFNKATMSNAKTLELHASLRKKRLRITEPRRIIINVLAGTKEHVSAEEVYMEVHKAHPNVGLTTVYRTLDLLEGMGVVTKLHFGDGRSRYELIESLTKLGHHHHLVCTICKRVIDYDDFVDEELELLKKVERELSKKHGFQITGHVIQFYGKCSRCKREA
jgi:Fur family ferric uptake transcriptional regulator